MTTDQSNDIRATCHDVLVAFLTAVDHHRATDALPCFTDDAQIVARGQHHNGRDEISRFLAERQADTARHTAHVIVNEVFEHVSVDHVELQARVVLLLHQPTTATKSTRSSKPPKRSGPRPPDGASPNATSHHSTPINDHQQRPTRPRQTPNPATSGSPTAIPSAHICKHQRLTPATTAPAGTPALCR